MPGIRPRVRWCDLALIDPDGARDRNRTGMTLRSGDFKSPASTCFATRAMAVARIVQENEKLEARVGIEPAYAELQSAA